MPEHAVVPFVVTNIQIACSKSKVGTECIGLLNKYNIEVYQIVETNVSLAFLRCMACLNIAVSEKSHMKLK
jgi:hypothetical protein